MIVRSVTTNSTAFFVLLLRCWPREGSKVIFHVEGVSEKILLPRYLTGMPCASFLLIDNLRNILLPLEASTLRRFSIIQAQGRACADRNEATSSIGVEQNTLVN